ncbi:MAG: hypothetical protein M3P51_13995 [Chloroflexota bacterium]|nr:hypothetical protein [Chloroflexota bacterium]
MSADRVALLALVLVSTCTASESERPGRDGGGGPLPSGTAVQAASPPETPFDSWYEDAGTGTTREEYLRAVQAYNLPHWAHTRAQRDGHTRTLALARHLNPFYQSGDFDADGSLDLAVLISRRTTGEIGILVLHGGSTSSVVIGAGEPFGNGGADFKWMTNWRVRPKRESAQRGDALEVVKLESASGLIYWNGHSYQWQQLDD